MLYCKAKAVLFQLANEFLPMIDEVCSFLAFTFLIVLGFYMLIYSFAPKFPTWSALYLAKQSYPTRWVPHGFHLPMPIGQLCF